MRLNILFTYEDWKGVLYTLQIVPQIILFGSLQHACEYVGHVILFLLMTRENKAWRVQRFAWVKRRVRLYYTASRLLPCPDICLDALMRLRESKKTDDGQDHD